MLFGQKHAVTVKLIGSTVTCAVFAHTANAAALDSHNFADMSNAQLVEHIRSVWRHRRESIEVLRCSLHCQFIYPKGCLNNFHVTNDAPAFDSVAELSREWCVNLPSRRLRRVEVGSIYDATSGTWKPFSEVRTYDGTFFAVQAGARYPRKGYDDGEAKVVIASAERHIGAICTVSEIPLLFVMGYLPAQPISFLDVLQGRSGKFDLYRRVTLENGAPGAILRAINELNQSVYSVAVDLSKDSSICSFTVEVRGRIMRQLDIHYERGPNQIWLPKAWDFVSLTTKNGEARLTQRVTVMSFAINGSLPEGELFRPTLHPNMLVERDGQKFVVASDGESFIQLNRGLTDHKARHARRAAGTVLVVVATIVVLSVIFRR